jgi:hypothetical protein
MRPRDLRSRDLWFQVYHATHVLRFVGYKIGYIFGFDFIIFLEPLCMLKQPPKRPMAGRRKSYWRII